MRCIKMSRFECRKVNGPSSGQASYVVWDTYAEERGLVPIVEVHSERSIAEKRCQDLSCDEDTGRALRWWVCFTAHRDKLLWSTRLFCLSPKDKEKIVSVHGMSLPHPTNERSELLHMWCRCIECLARAIYHLYCGDTRNRPNHDLKSAWEILQRHMSEEDLIYVDKELHEWQQCWNTQQDIPDVLRSPTQNFEQIFDKHRYDYNRVRYFADDIKSSKESVLSLDYFVNEVITVFVLDQYVLKKMEQYVYRLGDTDLNLPGIQIRVRDTVKIHRICSNMPDFRNRCLFVLQAVFLGAPFDLDTWNQILNRHTPQDYWRY